MEHHYHTNWSPDTRDSPHPAEHRWTEAAWVHTSEERPVTMDGPDAKPVWVITCVFVSHEHASWIDWRRAQWNSSGEFQGNSIIKDRVK